MSDKTVKQIADELGVTKQAIYKHLNKLAPTMVSTGANRTTLITPDGQALLRTWVSTQTPTNTPELVPTTDNSLVLDLQHKIELLELEKAMEIKRLDEKATLLQQELDHKNKQIEMLQSENGALVTALKDTTESLRASQALHAGTIQQQLEETSAAKSARRKWWRKEK